MRGFTPGCLPWFCAAVLSASFTAVSLARVAGDWVNLSLKDGREFFGQVTEETPFKLVVNVKQGAITAKMTFAKSDLSKIDVQKDAVEAALPTKQPAPKIVDDTQALEAKAAPGDGGYVYVPLSGSFGDELTAGLFHSLLQRAVDAKAEAIIFELDSTGGMVSELDKIRDEIDRYEGRIKVVFFVRDQAFSAAALLCLSSKSFYMGPTARIGAAVAFHQTDSGSREVDAKFNSAFASTWRARAEEVGRPGLIIDAMILMDRQVYADTTTEPWTLSATKPKADDPNVDKILVLDDARSILSLTQSQAVNTGAADGSAPDVATLLTKLELRQPGRRAIDGESLYRSWHNAYDRNMQVIRRAVVDYNDASEMLDSKQSIQKSEQRLRDMRGSLQRIITLYKKYDYVENYFMSRGQTLEDLDRLLRRINEALKEL